jgi:hypothetical protein
LFVDRKHHFSSTSKQNASFYNPISDNLSTNPQATADCIARLSGQISFDRIVNIKRYWYSGHVYNLSIEPEQIYISNGVIVKNCHCNLIEVYSGETSEAGAKDYNPNAVKNYIQSLSGKDQKSLMGVAGTEAFKEDPKSWQQQVNNFEKPREIKFKNIENLKTALYGK